VSKNSASGNFDGPLPPSGSFPEVSTNRKTGLSSRKVSSAGRSKSLRPHTPPPATVGKRAAADGRDGKGLVIFINRWNNLDAAAAHPQADTRSSTDRDLHTHLCAVYGLTLSSIHSNPIDNPVTNKENSHILPRQTHLVTTSYTHIDCMSIISAVH